MYAEKPALHDKQHNHQPGQLRTVSLDVTNRCSMACAHCYAETFREAEPIELDMLGRTLDEAWEMGVYHYVLQGGEPIEDLKRLEVIVGMCHPEETYLNVVSNGWNVTPETIQWLKGLQVDKIAFSLDSGIRREHDRRRRPGSFRRTLEAIDCVREAGLLTSISMVVTNQSLYSKGFRWAFELARAKGIRLDVQIAEPVGRWDGNCDVLLTPQDTRFIKDLYLASPVLENGQRMVNRDLYTGESDHCPAGTEFMAISVDGEFLPCNFLQFTLGNIRDHSLREMRDRLLTSPWFDGQHPVCLCGEDREFIAEFIMPHVGEKKPLDANEVFGLGGP